MRPTDTIADMLTRIRNGAQARKETVRIPGSKVKSRIAAVLKDEGFIEDFRTIEDDLQGQVEVRLRYTPDRRPVIEGIERVSKPGRRVYVGVDEIPRVKNGLGTAVLSTSSGLLTDEDARRRKIGGEVLFRVW